MTELEKNNLIYQEFLRIGGYYEGIDEISFSIISPLIRDAAFMRITLDELAAIINENGAIEEYRNGETQYGMKQSAALQSYINTMKVYTSTIKALDGWIPSKKSLSIREKWDRERMNPEELETLLAAERQEKAKASALWLEKLKAAYGGVPDEK